MGFCHGDVDQDRVVQDIREDLHPVQNLPLRNPDLPKKFSILKGKDVDPRDMLLARIPDARPLET
jgi:hypothetical protein